MAKQMQKLEYAIGVQDKGSGKIARLQKNIENMTKRVGKNLRSLGTAALGVVGAGLSIKAIAGPAIELNRALADVGALGVDTDGLQLLQKEAGRFAMQYGKNAADIVRSSAAIQERIDGLTARELAAFTGASNVLSLATRSSTESMTGYMSTMYGIFENQANRMGKIRWAEQMAGQTDFLARTFKVKGEDIAAGFDKLGNRATRVGLEAGEQMAVIAALERSMGGAAAGDRLGAFADNATKAGRALGVSFTDQKGKMLPIMDILDQMQAKFGDTMTEAEQIQFSKALGDKEAGAFLNTLLSKPGQLGKAVKDVKGITDMGGARASARQATDAFQRWGTSVDYVRANFMQKLLPTLERWTNRASDHLDTLNTWITRYPVLVTDRACIAQDIQHMIRESGLLVELIGERDVRKRKTNIVRLTLMVDQDRRIRPGTARIEEVWTDRNRVEYWLTAETLAFGQISFLAWADTITEA